MWDERRIFIAISSLHNRKHPSKESDHVREELSCRFFPRVDTLIRWESNHLLITISSLFFCLKGLILDVISEIDMQLYTFLRMIEIESSTNRKDNIVLSSFYTREFNGI